MSEPRLNDRDAAAVDALLAVAPVWTDLAIAGEALGLADRVVLHAGPPASGAVCQPILNSAAMAAIYEGWAGSEDEAHKLVASGEITFRPAQDLGCVVPLASVLTSRMAVHVVVDQGNPSNRAYAPINGGSGPALRLGLSGQSVVDHLRWLNGPLAEYLAGASVNDIPLIALADGALASGDDCHGRTIEATKALVDIMVDRAGAPADAIGAFFSNGPSFFLNLWMAASKCILAGAEGHQDSSVVTAIGGNGVETGIKIAGIPDRWFTTAAEPPFGALEPGNEPGDRLGAIGDSAVVDAVGLGAMAMHLAPAQQTALGNYMPEASDTLGGAIFARNHPAFKRVGVRSGLTARAIAEGDRALAVSLGIIHRAGKRGRIGGGISTPPVELFAHACKTMNETNDVIKAAPVRHGADRA